MNFVEYLLLIPLTLFSLSSLPKVMKKMHDSTDVKSQLLRIESQEGKPIEESRPSEGREVTSEALALEIQSGKASFYGKKHNGRKTASGERYNMDSFTAAHKFLPFGTKVKVTYNNLKSVVVRVNDRLPLNSKRAIDLSLKAAKELNVIRNGIVNVKIEVLEWGKERLLRKKAVEGADQEEASNQKEASNQEEAE